MRERSGAPPRPWISCLARAALCLAAGIAGTMLVVGHPMDRMVARLVSYPKVAALLGQNLVIVAVSCLMAILTAIPLGILLSRPRFESWAPRVLDLVNLGQTIPSLAVIALTVGLLGVGPRPAILALWAYSLLPVLNNTLVGLRTLDKGVLDAARGMGMRPFRMLVRVELPLAMPMILAGIRTSVTVNIGSSILAAFVGGGGMGNLIIAGNNINRWQVVALGAAWTVLMALAADALFDLLSPRSAS